MNLKYVAYFIRDHKPFYYLLIIFAIFIALFEGINITLLYPIISICLDINSSLSPYPRIFSFISDIFPVNSVFVSLILVFLILTSFLMIIQLLYWKFAYIFAKKITVSVKKDIYNKLLLCDYRLFEDKKQGELINLLNSGPSAITNTYELLMGLIADISLSIVILSTLFFVSPLGLVIVSIGAFFYYCINNRISKKSSIQIGKLNYLSQQSENVLVNEYITGIRAITVSNRKNYWSTQINQAISTYWDHYPRIRYLQRLPGLLMYSLFLLSLGLMILYLYIFFQDSFSSLIPIIGTFAIGLLRILPKASSLGYSYMQILQNSNWILALYSFLNDDTYYKIQNGNYKFSNLSSDIVFQDVCFSYDRDEILTDLSFIVKKGETTAIVGPSGAGKSTITALLLRLYDPVKGNICINDFNLKELEIGSYRDHIGYVGQEPFVFNATIRENIIFGGNYTDEEIKEAARLAHVDFFIQKLPEGYESIIGDHGIKLSGGEKQRLVIARAMLRKPDILILDEATASLDNISERYVQEAIDEVSKECTTIVIAHRLTTIERANMIYVIDQGKVVEKGNHSDLLNKRELYWRMYNSMKI